MEKSIVHIAIPCLDLESTKDFYINGLGYQLGRESETSVILNMDGQQLVAHKTDDIDPQNSIYPRHFGLIYSNKAQWQSQLNRCKEKELNFLQKERIRHIGELSEYFSFVLKDPSGNILEFKYYPESRAILGKLNSKNGD